MSLICQPTSEDIKHRLKERTRNRVQELRESRGGRPGLPSLINPSFLWTTLQFELQQDAKGVTTMQNSASVNNLQASCCFYYHSVMLWNLLLLLCVCANLNPSGSSHFVLFLPVIYNHLMPNQFHGMQKNVGLRRNRQSVPYQHHTEWQRLRDVFTTFNRQFSTNHSTNRQKKLCVNQLQHKPTEETLCHS